ncbi:MAG: TonB-dependent receptor [Phenylobacterium sp.]|uniref:TonB-dependent receptor n=1 Tax=Phenylobacterium sp. TaxID=1871053 RepID=UPI0027189507|nr:TonB-dependent receptor [Phenylobacterium sp.]MDO8409554.1 TonB-dependent receptor [Phenylobacterium sp.]
MFAFAAAAALGGGPAAYAQGPVAPTVDVDEITVTARRRVELLQDVPIPVTVLSSNLAADTGTYNVTRLKEIVPSVQFYSTNPRNSAINIRGLGSPYGLINDGIEPGVGLYIDGVFHARPAAATLDFVDIDQIEILRGPQGTLYGKNTTAGAINVTSKRPQFTPRTDVELSFGDLNYQQAKASVTGPITERLAGRLSFSGTRRDGVLYNTATQDDLNDLNNLGVKGQLLLVVSDSLEATLAVDYTRQRPEGYAQVVAGVAPTLRAANRRYEGIAADLGYAPPSFDAFDRVTDADTPHRSYQDVGGAALTVDWDVGPGSLTSITAWRYWDWNPSNDRDFLGLPITTISANPSEQRQISQELRYSGDLSENLNFVVGAFLFRQTIDSTGKQEQGSAAARFLLAPSAAAATPGLLDGYGQTSDISSTFLSAALFGQVEWAVTERLRLLPGLRINYDQKEVDYQSTVYGGLQTTDAALIALQRSILAPQTYAAKTDDTNLSGQLTVAYEVSDRVNAYATYATSFKSVGLNLGGVPNDASGAPALDAATVRPEEVTHYEVGLKTQPFRGGTANFSAYQTEIDDFQAQVVNASVGVLRGYLANAEKVRVRGVEFDGQARIGDGLSLYTAVAYTDAIYASFTDAPPPLELTGGPQVVDISGSRLPGVSKWAGSIGGEYAAPVGLAGREGEAFAGVDVSYRSSFSSSPSPSQYLNIDGYSLTNARLGFRAEDGWTAFVWARNLFDENYYELLSAAPGGSGLFVGLPGDGRTFGVTLRGSF